MRFLSKAQALFLSAVIFLSIAYAAELPPFLGQTNTENINIRSGSTIGAVVIYKAKKGDFLEVVSEAYDWYKIKLPKEAPAYIRKDLVSVIESVPSISPSAVTKIAPSDQNVSGQQQLKNAKIIKEKVNIRLFPNESSAIIGTAEKNEIIGIIGTEDGWFKIVPSADCFGWIHKKFVDKANQSAAKEEKLVSSLAKTQADYAKEIISVEGIVRPYGKVFRRTATHKLILEDNKTFLLKGNKNNLNLLNYRKVKVTGKIILEPGEKAPLIEIQKLEAVD